MGLLDSLQGLTSSQPQSAEGGASSPAVTQALVQEVDQHPGGLAGILNSFRQNGMEDHVNSWVGSGDNRSITPEQVQQGAGPDLVERIAQRAGIPAGVAKVALAAALPMLVSRLSQGGQQQVPGQGGLASVAGGLLSHIL